MGMRAQRKENRKPLRTVLTKDWLFFLWLSALGWIWEMLFSLFAYHRFSDRGFLALPICPIYGATIFIVFYLFGTPHRGRYVLKRIKTPFWRYAAYLFFACLLPTLAELFVGALFHRVWGVRLWDYSRRALNVMGYVSLPISLCWAVALTLFMRWFFLPMRNFLQSAPDKPARIFTWISASAVAVDAVYHFILLQRQFF